MDSCSVYRKLTNLGDYSTKSQAPRSHKIKESMHVAKTVDEGERRTKFWVVLIDFSFDVCPTAVMN